MNNITEYFTKTMQEVCATDVYSIPAIQSIDYLIEDNCVYITHSLENNEEIARRLTNRFNQTLQSTFGYDYVTKKYAEYKGLDFPIESDFTHIDINVRDTNVATSKLVSYISSVCRYAMKKVIDSIFLDDAGEEWMMRFAYEVSEDNTLTLYLFDTDIDFIPKDIEESLRINLSKRFKGLTLEKVINNEYQTPEESGFDEYYTVIYESYKMEDKSYEHN